MSSRYERIEVHWVADFRGRGKMTIELTPEDQEDPRLLALRDWWDERSSAQMAKAREENSGDPFTGV